MFIDSHVHFDGLHESAGGVAGVVERAVAAGVERMIAVGGDDSANRAALETAELYPGRVRAAIGYDRNCADGEHDRNALAELLESSKGGVRPVAVGEIGLDFHYSPDTAKVQRDLMISQLDVARDHALPVIVHSREAEDETVEVLGGSGARGVLHCFTGDAGFAKRILDVGFFISFSGIVTFNSADSVRDAARSVPDDRLLIETDSPFLAPVPYRGKQNEPAFLPQVAECVADVRGCSGERLAEVTATNTRTLFGI